MNILTFNLASLNLYFVDNWAFLHFDMLAFRRLASWLVYIEGFKRFVMEPKCSI